MTGAILCWLIFGFCILSYPYEMYFRPILKTRPPVKKILDLVKRQDGFSVHDKPGSPWIHSEVGFFVDFVLQDTVNSTKTGMGIDKFHGTVHMSGDFEWMNEYERKRLYRIIKSISDSRIKKHREASLIEKQEMDDRKRRAAMKVYENR